MPAAIAAHTAAYGYDTNDLLRKKNLLDVSGTSRLCFLCSVFLVVFFFFGALTPFYQPISEFLWALSQFIPYLHDRCIWREPNRVLVLFLTNNEWNYVYLCEIFFFFLFNGPIIQTTPAVTIFTFPYCPVCLLVHSL